MSVPYCAENVLSFYNTVKQISQTLLPRNIFEEDTTKFSRKTTHLPFSVLALQSAQAESSKRYYAVSNMHVGPLGSFGRIKVGYPLMLKNDSYTIDFSRPTAIKICLGLDTVSKDAQHFMSEIFPDIYSAGAWTRHNDAGDHFKFYYTMPLYPGHDLFEFLSSRCIEKLKKLPFNLALNIMLQVSEKLKKIHDLGYVHSDIKPENIIIYYDDDKTLDLKFIDFDFIAKINTFIGKLNGTEGYIAPEISLAYYSHEPIIVEHSMDIYSLGKVFETIINITDTRGVSDYAKTEMKLLPKNMCATLRNRVSLQNILETLETIFIQTRTQKIPSHGEEGNSSLLPEGFNSCLQLNVEPIKQQQNSYSQKTMPEKRKLNDGIYTILRRDPYDTFQSKRSNATDLPPPNLSDTENFKHPTLTL